MQAGLGPEDMAACQLDPGLGVFPSYRSLLSSQQSLAQVAGDPEAYLCLSLAQGRRIVGFCAQRPPRPDERWARLRPPVMQEMFGEVGRGWRGMGLIETMLGLVVQRPDNDGRILYIMGYSWHWDLDGSRKSLQEYRDTIIHLLSPLDFKQFPTNEPNICLRPENLFMARVGPKVDQALRRRFTNLLFGIEDDP